MAKTLILIRHAHRDTDLRSEGGRLNDNGLSDKGKDQVKRLIKFIEKRIEGTDFVFFSSPKKRCIETLTPIAERANQKVTVDSRLDENGSSESMSKYFSRMDDFIEYWKYESPEVTVVCSHGDWIPYAVERLTTAKIDLKKAGCCELVYNAGVTSLTWIVQKHY